MAQEKIKHFASDVERAESPKAFNAHPALFPTGDSTTYAKFFNGYYCELAPGHCPHATAMTFDLSTTN